MTDEEIDALIKEVSGELDKLADNPEKPLTGKERSHRRVLQLRREALKKIQVTRETGSLQQEVKAIADYNLLTEYGDRPFLLHLMKARFTRLGL